MFTDEQFGIWGTDENYGSAENMANYLPSRLIRKQADAFKAKTRLVISGKSKFGTLSDKRFPYDGPSHTEAFHGWPNLLASNISTIRISKWAIGITAVGGPGDGAIEQSC